MPLSDADLMILDLDLVRRASDMAHRSLYDASRQLLGRKPQVEFIADDECIPCRLGGLTGEESKAAHA